MLVNILQCTGQTHPPTSQQRIIWAKMSVMLRLKSPVLEKGSGNEKIPDLIKCILHWEKTDSKLVNK